MKLHGGDVNVVPKVESSVGNTILISVPFEVTDNNEVLDLQSTTQDVSRASKLENNSYVANIICMDMNSTKVIILAASTYVAIVVSYYQVPQVQVSVSVYYIS